jgi:hypothetical protein
MVIHLQILKKLKLNIKPHPFLFVPVFTLFVACKNKPGNIENQSGNASVTDSNAISETNIRPITNLEPVWILDISDAGKNKMKKLREPDSAVLTDQNLVAILNLHHEKVQCVFHHRSNDTMYISIPDSEYLTQRMGTSGSEAYMAEAVFTLTEKKGVQYINFDFIEGDHAIPGTYSRKDFAY